MSTECYSGAARLPASAAGERVLTVDELARRFRVSRKTVSRWRRRGLIGRQRLFDGRPRIGFLQSSVDRFVADNAERVRRGARFSRMKDKQRKQMIERARCLAQACGGPGKVTMRVAQETGRSLETVRDTLKRFDQEHPEIAIFPSILGSNEVLIVRFRNILRRIFSNSNRISHSSSCGVSFYCRSPETIK